MSALLRAAAAGCAACAPVRPRAVRAVDRAGVGVALLEVVQLRAVVDGVSSNLNTLRTNSSANSTAFK